MSLSYFTYEKNGYVSSRARGVLTDWRTVYIQYIESTTTTVRLQYSTGQGKTHSNRSFISVIIHHSSCLRPLGKLPSLHGDG
jgi:hypothetical protein